MDYVRLPGVLYWQLFAQAISLFSLNFSRASLVLESYLLIKVSKCRCNSCSAVSGTFFPWAGFCVTVVHLSERPSLCVAPLSSLPSQRHAALAVWRAARLSWNDCTKLLRHVVIFLSWRIQLTSFTPDRGRCSALLGFNVPRFSASFREVRHFWKVNHHLYINYL